MARNHARIFTEIWRDPEFRALTSDAQLAYLTVLSHPDLTYVGVMDYLPQKLAGLAMDGNDRRTRRALAGLEDSRFLVIDHSVAEMCVRSLVRHDGVFGRFNMGKATARALEKVMSLTIRKALIDEMARLRSQQPDLAGWSGFAEINPDAMARIDAIASSMASGM